MRPVERGTRPLDENGAPKHYPRYQLARGDLIARLGEYCSYCEAKLPASLAVEHVLPKSLNPELEREWNNFLLGCTNCNSTKSARDIRLQDYYWPDVDNTLLAIRYKEEGIVTVAEGLNDAQTARAAATIELVGLDKTPDRDPEASDRRWLHRRTAWQRATLARQRFETQPHNELLHDTIVELAEESGHWSIWFSVFLGIPAMQRRFAAAFMGTSMVCFDDSMNSIARVGGAI
jgi:uncharacterized protein (TIGR02646 family)